MTWVEVSMLFVVACIPVGWGFWQLKLNEKQFKLDRKSYLFQQVIAASEEMREAFFNDPKKAKSTRYLGAAKEMNFALAGIAIYADRELAEKCFNLENLAKERSKTKREFEMNEIIDLMRSELKLNKEDTRIRLEWT